MAIERARLYERERRRARLLETINEVSRRLGAIHSEHELLPQIVRYVREHLGYDSANLLLLDEERNELELVAACGLGNEALIGGRIPAAEESSISGWVLTHGEPLLANDVRREPRHYAAGGGEQAELAAPIYVKGRPFGVLDVQSARTNAFHEMDIAALQTLAGQLGVAIESARLYEDTQRALKRARAFQDLTTAIIASLDLEPTIERALDAAVEVFGADRTAVYLVDPATQRMRCAAGRNLSDEYVDAVHRAYDASSHSPALEAESSIYVEDAWAAPLMPALAEASRREGFRSMLFLPLRGGGDLFGMFILYSDRIRRYTDEETALARLFADQVAIAIKHARLFEAERRAREQTATILDATRTIASSLQIDDVLTRVAAAIATALGQRACAVWLLNEEGTAFVPAYRVANPPNPRWDDVFFALPPIPIDDTPRIETLLAGRPYVVERPEELSPAERAVRQALPFESYAAIPLAAGERVVGVAAVPIARHGHDIDPADIEVAMAIARSAALAVENARLYAQAQRLAVSEERNRLARELHDSVTHALFSMTLIIQALPRLLERNPERARERIDRLNELGRGALAEMRALIFQLRPAALEEEGLVSALTKHTAAFESREGIAVELHVEGERRLPLPVEEAVFRVAQEALNNVAKHARATRVRIALTFTDDSLELTVSDDGAGFDPQAPRTDRRSLGLTSMRERAAILRGDWEIDSAPGRGTTVRLSIPAPARMKDEG